MTATTETEAKLKEILAEILEVDKKEIDGEFGPGRTPLWDSLNHLRIVSEIETEFSMKLSMAEIKTLTDFCTIMHVVDRYVK